MYSHNMCFGTFYYGVNYYITSLPVLENGYVWHTNLVHPIKTNFYPKCLIHSPKN